MKKINTIELKELNHVTLQLNDFIKKMYEDDVTYHMYYQADFSSLWFMIKDSKTHYSLVTQKNEFRKFASLSAVFKTLPICSNEHIDFHFESSER